MKIPYKISRRDLLTILDCLIATNATETHPKAFKIMFGSFLIDLQKRLGGKAFYDKPKFTISFSPIELMLLLVILESCIALRPDLTNIKVAYMAIDQPIPPHVQVAINITRRHLQSVTGETKKFMKEVNHEV